jgi:hypothetical protein
MRWADLLPTVIFFIVGACATWLVGIVLGDSAERGFVLGMAFILVLLVVVLLLAGRR